MTREKSIEFMDAPEVVRLPLALPVGVPALPCVEVGDRVLKGQCVAKAAPGLSLPVHSPVSGRVIALERTLLPDGMGDVIVIENDRKSELSPEVVPWQKPLSQAKPEEITAFMREKGIAGMGGAAFPAWAKADAARGKVKILLVNGAESEPYLTSVHRLLVERTAEVVGGVKILMRATGATHAIFVVQNDKEDAVEKLMEEVAGSAAFSVNAVRTKYPQGDERILAKTVLGKEVPHGKMLTDIGAVTFNAETAWAVYRAFVRGLPQIERLVTVSGEAVANPSVLLVPLGTSFGAVFDRCGGFSRKPDRLVAGGPLMGRTLPEPSVPVTRETGAALALEVGNLFSENGVCIRCGRCLTACPMHLMPLHFYRLARAGKYLDTERYFITDCTTCGACAYACPARLPLVETIRRSKAAVKAARTKQKGEEERHE